MKNQIDFVYDIHGCIRCGGWRLWPWPNFQMEAIAPEAALSPTEALCSVLGADDLFCLLWKGQIPENVIKELCRFPVVAPEALMVAQLNPQRVIQLCQRSPFVAMLLWSLVDKVEQTVASEDGPLRILTAAGFPASDQTIETVQKITASSCQPEIIPAMRKAIRCPLRSRLLAAAEVIDEEICDLLRLPVRDRRVQDALAAMIREEAFDGSL